MKLSQLGWTPEYQKSFLKYAEKGWRPARVVRPGKNLHRIMDENGERNASVQGSARNGGVRPVLGDWVACREEGGTNLIHAVLPRHGVISRRAPGTRTEEQLLAVNVDIAILVQGLGTGRSFSPRSLERYITMAWEAGCQPVVVLNKTDLSADPEADRMNAEAVSPGVDILMCSAILGQGVEELRRCFKPGQTAVLLGPSGVGKSSLLNELAGFNLSSTGELRKSQGKGRHTTTHRELFILDDGRILLDTPGLRELQLWGNADSADSAFPEIEEYAGKCRFRDCRHENEPGCAIQEALRRGNLEAERFESWLKLRRELQHLESRKDEKVRKANEQKWRKITMEYRDMKKGKTIW